MQLLDLLVYLRRCKVQRTGIDRALFVSHRAVLWLQAVESAGCGASASANVAFTPASHRLVDLSELRSYMRLLLDSYERTGGEGDQGSSSDEDRRGPGQTGDDEVCRICVDFGSSTNIFPEIRLLLAPKCCSAIVSLLLSYDSFWLLIHVRLVYYSE